jgi:proline dehydrogenase
MLEALSRAAFSTLANSIVLKTLASRYGMRRQHSFARRFIAGETMDEAIACARKLERQGLMITLDHLGERVGSRQAATDATRDYIEVIKAAAAAGISRNVSVKLTQLGLDIDRATAIDNIRRVLDVAQQSDCFVRIDMEQSAYTAVTFEVFETVWSIGSRNVGVVIQSYLKRSPADVKRMNELGARVRLVKGAYKEPKDVAYQHKTEVDAAYLELMQALMLGRHYPAIATHDEAMLEATKRFAAANGIARDEFEFQMLYGIRRDLQLALSREGYPFRVYVPFGTDWFPYFMRRLGERPANLGFVFRSLAKEEARLGV